MGHTTNSYSGICFVSVFNGEGQVKDEGWMTEEGGGRIEEGWMVMDEGDG